MPDRIPRSMSGRGRRRAVLEPGPLMRYNRIMTAQEKADIYNLLKKAACHAQGFMPREFACEPPAFMDDAETEVTENDATTDARPEIPAAYGADERTLAINSVSDGGSRPTNERSEAQNEHSSADSGQAPERSAGSGVEDYQTFGQKNARSGITLDEIRERIRSCSNCVLGTTRINTVPGEGVENPLVLVIGEGPGEDEDKTGRPFVGRAGQLLDKMLAAIQLDRNRNCYIANIVKCRPPHNRTPMPDEASACAGFLQAQIHILRPKMILAMGRTAVQNLLHTEQGINALRGKFFDLDGIPLLATYHPSALLRNETLKRPAWEDLKTFKARLKELSPDYDKI